MSMDVKFSGYGFLKRAGLFLRGKKPGKLVLSQQRESVAFPIYPGQKITVGANPLANLQIEGVPITPSLLKINYKGEDNYSLEIVQPNKPDIKCELTSHTINDKLGLFGQERILTFIPPNNKTDGLKWFATEINWLVNIIVRLIERRGHIDPFVLDQDETLAFIWLSGNKFEILSRIALNPNNNLQRKAISALGEMNHKDVFQVLKQVASMANNKVQVQEHAVAVLQKIIDIETDNKIRTRTGFRTSRKLCEIAANPDICKADRKKAVVNLWLRGSANAIKMIEEIAKNKHIEAFIRIEALTRLWQLGLRSTLAQIATDESDTEIVRKEAITNLWQLGVRSILQQIARNDINPNLRIHAATLP